MRKIQEVHLGMSQAGMLGFFTGAYMAYPFCSRFPAPTNLVAARKRAERLGFSLLEGENDAQFFKVAEANQD